MLKIIFAIIFVYISLFSFLEPAAAQATVPSKENNNKKKQTDQQTKTFPNPLGEGMKSIPMLIGRVISAILGIVGSIALIMFVYGGLTWMTAMGNQERVKKGGDILMWAAIGLLVIFSAYAMVKFVIEGLTT